MKDTSKSCQIIAIMSTSSDLPLDCVEHKDNPAVDHVPLIPWHIVENIRNGRMLFDADALKQGLLPETSTSFDGGDGIDDA